MNKSLYLKALLFTGLLGAAFFLGQQFNSSPNTAVSLQRQELDTSAAKEVWDIIQDSYLRTAEVDEHEVKYGLARGLMGILKDPHSAFMDPKESKAFMSSLSGDLQGIGAELKLEDGFVMVSSPLPGSPAEKAGIKPGDVIMKVNGEVLGSIENLFDVVMKIRGPKGEAVILTVLHDGEVTPVDITIIRDEIHLEAVKLKMEEYKGEEIAVISVSSFTKEIGQEFGNVLADAVKQNARKIIIDLRFNGGGFLEGAIDLISYFTEPDQIAVLTKNRDSEEKRYTVQKELRFLGKVAIIVNDSSASASEIVAGTLQDYELARVFGIKTFGKGSVQEVQPLSDGSVVRVTVAEWLTPKRRSIEKVGIEPDELVELDYEEFKDGKDNQLNAALEYLSGL